MDQPKLKNVYNKNCKFINLQNIISVLAYNHAKIDKQCEHCVTRMNLLFLSYTFLCLVG